MSSFDINNVDNIKHNIEIWSEKHGKKKNTLISGWNIDIHILKKHLLDIKKKKGCNGTIKKDNTVLLQGEHINYIYTYLLENSIKSEDINIKYI